ncbi:MAG TPA: hypothetical protein VL981_00985 [Candidatus Methylacidiphilales bacterium]|nr:hypothetical protein [Candidatus Methylacidiphilales bacterium]
MSGIGLLGGLKIPWLAINGEIQQLISTKAMGVAPNISSEDVVYFAIRGFALSWLSIETIWKRCLD